MIFCCCDSCDRLLFVDKDGNGGKGSATAEDRGGVPPGTTGTSSPRSQEKLGRYSKLCPGSSRSSKLRRDFFDKVESKLRESEV